jgi:hypothetical protein
MWWVCLKTLPEALILDLTQYTNSLHNIDAVHPQCQAIVLTGLASFYAGTAFQTRLCLT